MPGVGNSDGGKVSLRFEEEASRKEEGIVKTHKIYSEVATT